MTVRYLMIDRIVKSQNGYYIYIFGNDAMSKELRNRKNNEYCLLSKEYVPQSGFEIKTVKFIKENQSFIVNKEPMSFSKYQQIFCAENDNFKTNTLSKKLGIKKESNDDKFVTHLLESLTGDSTFIGDDEGVAITEKLLGNHSTHGFDIDILDDKRKIAFEFLRRVNPNVNNLTAHPMRYAWNPKHKDNRQKFLSLWDFCVKSHLKLILISYSMHEPDSSIFKIIIPQSIDPTTGFTKDTEYCLKENEFLDFMKSDQDPEQYLKLESYPSITLYQSEFKTRKYVSKLVAWANNLVLPTHFKS